MRIDTALLLLAVALEAGLPAPAEAGSSTRAGGAAGVTGVSVQQGVSPLQREIEANRQMQEYRDRVSSQAARDRERSLSQAPPDVSLRLNDEIGSASTIFYYDNMESGTGAWSTGLYGGTIDDIWHLTTLQASSPTRSWWPGIELQGDYSTGRRINTALVSPTIDLSGASAPVTLLFLENFVTERGWDYCMVDITTDGGLNWTDLRGGYGSAPTGDTEGWRISMLDLSAYAGASVNIRFYFDTGDSMFNAFPGWFVDDVVVFDLGGTLTGRKFFDVNNNGAKDTGERGVSDWHITASGPVSITMKTDYSGRFYLTLPLGTYTVTEEAKPGWTQTYPPGGSWIVSLASPDTTIDSLHFGNYIPASFISGVKFDDVNRNGFYDIGDTTLRDWRIFLSDTNGVKISQDRTDSLGVYSLYVFEPGTYKVHEADVAHWIQTYPPTETYTITIPSLGIDSTGFDFGNYFSDSSNSIYGQKFNDLNRNGVKDDHEPGVGGFTIKLTGARNKNRVTDSLGYFAFVGLPAGPYTVREVGKNGWWQSYPDSVHSVLLAAGQFVDNADFGNYEIAPSSISGVKWNDLNDDGIKDVGEPGLSGWKINLGGKVTATTTTGPGGEYSFTGLWPGAYTVSETWKPYWRQTWPTGLSHYAVPLDPETAWVNVDFGNVIDSLFSTSFRTFTAESLALAKDHKGKRKPAKAAPNKVEFTAIFVNGEATTVSRLTAIFRIAVLDSVTFDRPGVLLMTGKQKRIEITLDSPLAVGETLAVHGFGKNPLPQSVKRWWWTHSDLSLGAPVDTGVFTLNVLRYPMPNAINLMMEVSNGLRVGLGGPHSVVHANYKGVMKSLWERGDRMHIGVPRCLDRKSGPIGRPLRKELRYLAPKTHNNALFAEAVALQVNIRASDNLNAPPGFGDLIYDESSGGALPLDGMNLRAIALNLDRYMSSWPDTAVDPDCHMPAEWVGLSPDTIYNRIRRINGSFSGPLDTVSFATGLRFSGVGSVDDVDYLRLDTSAIFLPRGLPPPLASWVPEAFSLGQNYPNPFNPTSTVEFYLPSEGLVTVIVYNVLGEEVARLLDAEYFEDGYQEFTVDAAELSSGVYFYRIDAETSADEDFGTPAARFSSVKKMVVMK